MWCEHAGSAKQPARSIDGAAALLKVWRRRGQVGHAEEEEARQTAYLWTVALARSTFVSVQATRALKDQVRRR